jgi:hypothetical protein
MTDTTLDPKILNKNLEITRILKDLDDLKSDYVELKEKYNNKILDERDALNQVVDLTNEKMREQVPMHMLNTLETCYKYIARDRDGFGDLSLEELDVELAKDLRKVIKFLQQ